jgi:CRISPR-associated protein Cas5d
VRWKPSLRWVVERIEVLRPIRFVSVRRNEVGQRATPPTTAQISGHAPPPSLDATAQRQQRASLLLSDVGYVIQAHIELSDKAGPGETPVKFREMFQRRASRGQWARPPCLGCREFAADVRLADATTPAPMVESRDLGWMLHDIVWSGGSANPRFFRAEMKQGVIEVPPLEAPGVVT